MWSVCIQIAISSDLIITLNEAQFYSVILFLYRLMVRSLQCFPDTSRLKFVLRAAAHITQNCSDPQFDVSVLFEDLSMPAQHLVFTSTCES